MSDRHNIDVVSYHASQPTRAFVEVSIAGHKVRSKIDGVEDNSPSYIQSFEFTRIMTNTGTISLTMFDPEYDQIENLFGMGWKSLEISYGYLESIQTTLTCIMTNYSITYHTMGATIVIQGTSFPNRDNTKLVSGDTGTNNPAEAVAAICKAMGWEIGEIESTKGGIREDNYTLTGDHPVDYINNVLKYESARDPDGATDYEFWIDADGKANYKVVSFQEYTTPKRNYFFGKGINSSVLELSLSVTGVFGGSGDNSTSTSVSATVIDTETGETSTVSANTSQVNPVGNSDSTDTPNDQEDIVAAGGKSSAEAAAAITHAQQVALPYKGSITVLGEPELQMGDCINLVIVGGPKGSERDLKGTGTYFVKKIQDTISGGTYRSTVEIISKLSDQGANLVTGSEDSTDSAGDSDSTDEGGDYSINKKVSKVRIRIIVPNSGKGTGHYEMHIPSGACFKGTVYKDTIISFGSKGITTCTESYDRSQRSSGNTLYYFEVGVSGDKFASFIKKLEGYTTGVQKSKNYTIYPTTFKYNISSRNCFSVLATWMDYLGYSTLKNIVKSSKSYKDYTAPVLYKKYGKNWKRY